MSIINEYMKNNRSKRCEWQSKRLECNDGFTMSVQASEYAYSSPRIMDADFYYKVEVGFPSAAPTFFMDYAEEADKPTETVYGYVPIELVEKEIEFHGGIKGPQVIP